MNIEYNIYQNIDEFKLDIELSDIEEENIKYKKLNFNYNLNKLYENQRLNKIKKITELKLLNFLADEYQFISFSNSEPFIYKNIYDSIDFIEEQNKINHEYDIYNKFFKKIEEQYNKILKDFDYFEISNKIFNIIYELNNLQDNLKILFVYNIKKNIIMNNDFKMLKYIDNILKDNNIDNEIHYYIEKKSLNELNDLNELNYDYNNKNENNLYTLKNNNINEDINDNEIYKKIDKLKNKRNIELYSKNQFDFDFINNIDNNNKKDIIIINLNENDINNMDILIEKIFYYLYHLNENGDMWLNINYFSNDYLFIEFIYILSIFFEKIVFKKNDVYVNDINSGIFIFKKFKNINFLNKIYEGLKTQIMIMRVHNKEIENKNIKDLKNKKISGFIKKYKINKYFIKFIDKIYNEIEKNLINYYKKIEFIHEKLFIKKIDEKFYNYFNFISKTCLEWCKNNNFLIEDGYENKIQRNFTSDYFKFKLFPKEKGVDIKRISLTYESVYSVSSSEEAEETSLLILKYFPKVKTILDATSNVGGNTINFAKYFEKVYSIEIDDETYNALKKNVELYFRKNVLTIKGDYTLLKDNYKTDLVFFDPPWGGIYYKINDKIDMFLSNINIVNILPNNFILKAPMNYNIESLLNKFKNLVICKMKNYLIIINNDYIEFYNNNLMN